MRYDIRDILADPVKRRALMIPTIIAIQAREGIETTYEQAAAAYDNARLLVRRPCLLNETTETKLRS